MRRKSNYSNKYFEKKYYKRRKNYIPKDERLYYSTEVVVEDDEDLMFRPNINIYFVSLDDPKVQKELENKSYRDYLRSNYSSKKGGNYDE